MRTIIFFAFMFFLLCWASLAAYLSGYIPAEYIPANLKNLTLPRSTTELGDSLSIIDGLFSSIAIVLGLIAILLQGKELKESTKAQTKQAHSLEIQIAQQNSSNTLGAYTARLQFLLAEVDRLEGSIDDMIKKTYNNNEKEKNRLWQIINNSRKKQNDYIKETQIIDEKVKKMLSDTDRVP